MGLSVRRATPSRLAALRRFLRLRVSREWIIGLRRIPTSTASQRDMDRLLELTWRQRVRAREEARAAARLRAQMQPLYAQHPYLRRQAQ